MGTHVRCPDVALAIDAQAVRSGEETLSKRTDKLAVVVELINRRIPADQNPNMPFGVECHARCGSRQAGAGWKREWIGYGHVIEVRRSLRNQQCRIRRPLREDQSDGD